MDNKKLTACEILTRPYRVAANDVSGTESVILI